MSISIEEKQCRRCLKVYPRNHYIKYGKICGLCDDCEKERQRLKQRQATAANPEKYRKISLTYYRKNQDQQKQKRKERYKEYRQTVINHYTNNDPKCACCGEREDLFLTIDHINNDGHKDRKSSFVSGTGRRVTGGQWVYKQIINNNFPSDIQILCYNCNCGKARNKGICPHKSKGKDIT